MFFVLKSVKFNKSDLIKLLNSPDSKIVIGVHISGLLFQSIYKSNPV